MSLIPNESSRRSQRLIEITKILLESIKTNTEKVRSTHFTVHLIKTCRKLKLKTLSTLTESSSLCFQSLSLCLKQKSPGEVDSKALGLTMHFRWLPRRMEKILLTKITLGLLPQCQFKCSEKFMSKNMITLINNY